MISWENVTKVFATDLLRRPVTALDDVSFSLREGSMTGYLGANGAGKTTSLKIALGFTTATSGQVRFSPSLGATPREALARTGFLPERPYFYPHLTGLEFSDYMGALSGVPRSVLGPRRTELAERLNVPVVPAQGPPMPGEIRCTAVFVEGDLGKYVVMFARDSWLTTNLVWSVGGQDTDVIQTRVVVQANIRQPAIIQRMRIATTNTGHLGAEFFRREQAR